MSQWRKEMDDLITETPAKKIRHRDMLVRATADIISESGIAGTSITKVVERAGLSRGMVHLHFENKAALLLEVARHMSDEYYARQKVFISDAGPTSQEKLAALITADLSEEILNQYTVNIWYAFRGEARSDNGFMAYSDTRDEALYETYYDAYIKLAAGSENPQVLARDATRGTIALTEGMWVDFFLHPLKFNRGTAKRIIFRFMAGLFQTAFNQDGAILT